MKNSELLNAALERAKIIDVFAKSAPNTRVYLGTFQVEGVNRRAFYVTETGLLQIELFISPTLRDRVYFGEQASAFINALDATDFAFHVKCRAEEWETRTLVDPWTRNECAPPSNVELLTDALKDLLAGAGQDQRVVFYTGLVDRPSFQGSPMAWALNVAEKNFRVDVMAKLDSPDPNQVIGRVEYSLVGDDARKKVNAIDARNFSAQFARRRAEGFPRR